MGKKRPTKNAKAAAAAPAATHAATRPTNQMAAVTPNAVRPMQLTGSSVVLVNGNNGCFLPGETVIYYVDPPDPGPFCYYFATVYVSLPGPAPSLRHVYMSQAAESTEMREQYLTFDLPSPVEPAAPAAKSVAANNTCTYYLLVITRVCFGSLAYVVGSVPFRVCDTCP